MSIVYTEFPVRAEIKTICVIPLKSTSMLFQFRKLLCWLLLFGGPLAAQPFYVGADLSYVNEMEDCGAVYKEAGTPKDPYAIFAGHGCQLVRLRLWHTPDWYDALNEGRRYSDLTDVRRSIQRARSMDMQVLLDYHLSDNWADPGKQVVPKAWSPVVNDLPTLEDSLYNYIYQTLIDLHADGLLPEMIQIGNETNKGILLSHETNDAGWTLDWDRNSRLFNKAIAAVRKAEQVTGEEIQVVIHAAGPADADWIFDQFIEHGVTDFDIMGISYYWAWHKPTNIDQTGQYIAKLRDEHPGYDVMIVETGYVWTSEAQDEANNIISEVHPDYSPASPEAQRDWLIDLTKTVQANGGLGVLYWEPAWVSTNCRTQWGRGSHQEHATFFDFDHNLLPNGGIAWLAHDYGTTTNLEIPESMKNVRIFTDSSGQLVISWSPGLEDRPEVFRVLDSQGKVVTMEKVAPESMQDDYYLSLPSLSVGVYFVLARRQGDWVSIGKVFVSQ